VNAKCIIFLEEIPYEKSVRSWEGGIVNAAIENICMSAYSYAGL